jgi:hypothetical protein
MPIPFRRKLSPLPADINSFDKVLSVKSGLLSLSSSTPGDSESFPSPL